MSSTEEAIAVMARALRYYADPGRWREDDWGVSSVIGGSEYGEPGKRARAALKKADAILARGEIGVEAPAKAPE